MVAAVAVGLAYFWRSNARSCIWPVVFIGAVGIELLEAEL